MIYTSGVVKDITRTETLEELQDNKLALVCTKLDLKPEDRLLDIGCGWGTLSAFAAKNYGCDVTGITLGKNQTAFGNQRIKDNGVSHDKARILCMDYREIPGGPGHYTKIVSLEMAEVRLILFFVTHRPSLRCFAASMLVSAATARSSARYTTSSTTTAPSSSKSPVSAPPGNTKTSSGLSSPHPPHPSKSSNSNAPYSHRGLFMNKYIFPGADASCSLGWVINQVEAAGFEVKQVDVLGVHYSATIYRWYQNWVSNKDKVIEKYGERYAPFSLHFPSTYTLILNENDNSVGTVSGSSSLRIRLLSPGKQFLVHPMYVPSKPLTHPLFSQGSASVFQITLHKNLNAYHRIEGVPSHTSLHAPQTHELSYVPLYIFTKNKSQS